MALYFECRINKKRTPSDWHLLRMKGDAWPKLILSVQATSIEHLRLCWAEGGTERHEVPKLREEMAADRVKLLEAIKPGTMVRRQTAQTTSGSYS